jgi:UDP-glucose 4-epimerase
LLKVLITGASGFIGRNLAEAFAGRYELHAPSSSELNLLDEYAVSDYLATFKFDVIIHAATTRSNRRLGAPPDMLDRNCRMFFNLARNQYRFGKLLSFGSGAEYDCRNLPPRVIEDYFDTRVPADSYGFSKYICAKYAENHPAIINLRLFGVFGKYEAWDVRFLSNACARVVSGLPIVIRQNVVFDYLFIDDLARITAWFIEHEPGHRTCNVCSGERYELQKLAQIVADVSGRRPDINVLNPGIGLEYTADNSRLLYEMPGFQCEPIEQSISKLYRWYEEHRAILDPAMLRYDG